MHLLSECSGIVKLFNLTWFLDKPHRDHILDKLFGRMTSAILSYRGDLADQLLRNPS